MRPHVAARARVGSHRHRRSCVVGHGPMPDCAHASTAWISYSLYCDMNYWWSIQLKWCLQVICGARSSTAPRGCRGHAQHAAGTPRNRPPFRVCACGSCPGGHCRSGYGPYAAHGAAQPAMCCAVAQGHHRSVEDVPTPFSGKGVCQFSGALRALPERWRQAPWANGSLR